MNGLTLAKIAKADALLNATHFIIAAKLPDETQITIAGVTACLIRPITLAVVRGFEGDWKNRRSNLGQKRAAIDSCDSRHAAKDGVLARPSDCPCRTLGRNSPKDHSLV